MMILCEASLLRGDCSFKFIKQVSLNLFASLYTCTNAHEQIRLQLLLPNQSIEGIAQAFEECERTCRNSGQEPCGLYYTDNCSKERETLLKFFGKMKENVDASRAARANIQYYEAPACSTVLYITTHETLESEMSKLEQKCIGRVALSIESNSAAEKVGRKIDSDDKRLQRAFDVHCAKRYDIIEFCLKKGFFKKGERRSLEALCYSVLNRFMKDKTKDIDWNQPLPSGMLAGAAQDVFVLLQMDQKLKNLPDANMALETATGVQLAKDNEK
eukprot:Nk52_evm1s2510 gene=Nk52_evmTU1s2510